MSSPQVVIFVQARMGSTRLPKKVLRTIFGREILLHQIDRIRQSKTVSEVVVITTEKTQDDPIVELCERNGLSFFRGSEHDLLDRHYKAAVHYKADLVAKIPSDCPLADPAVIDQVLSIWLENQDKYDYVSNYHAPTFPDGLDVEGIPFHIFEQAWKEATKPHEREHTTPFIWDHPERFRIGNVVNPRGDMFMTHRWTLDYEEDFQFFKAVFEALQDKPNFNMDDVLDLLKRRPDIEEINKKYAGVNWYRNVEGQLKTVDKSQYRHEPPKE